MDILIANGAGAARENEIARKYLGTGPRVVVLSGRHRGSSALAMAQRAMARVLARRRALKFMREIQSPGETVVLHARGSAMHLGGHLRAQCDRARLVLDIRGDAAAEARFNLAGEAGERRAAMVDRMDDREALRLKDRMFERFVDEIDDARIHGRTEITILCFQGSVTRATARITPPCSRFP
jgi:hypothetical protein